MKQREFWNLLTICVLVVLLSGMTACNLFNSEDDDDDDNDDNVDIYRNCFIGTWYRYSRTLDGASNDFISAKLVMEADGSGSEYTYRVINSGDQTRDEVITHQYEITWDTQPYYLIVTDEEMDTSLIEGNYFLGVDYSFMSITNESGMEDVFVRQTDDISESLVGRWWLDSLTVEGTEYDTESFPILELTSSGTIPSNFEGGYSWGVNDSFLILVSLDDPNYQNFVYSYYFEEGSNSLVLNNSGRDDIDVGWNPYYSESFYSRILSK